MTRMVRASQRASGFLLMEEGFVNLPAPFGALKRE